MRKEIFTTLNPSDLINLINEGIKEQLQEFISCKNHDSITNVRPHLTRREAAQFFDVSLNCLNDWSKKGILKPFKVGQRVYFSRQECINVLFNQTNND